MAAPLSESSARADGIVVTPHAHRKRGPWPTKVKDETSRQIMLEIAEGYERLAKHAEERAKKRTNAST